MNDCVRWDGWHSKNGYGLLRDEDGKLILAHRHAMAEQVGWDVIAGKNVNHHCDVRDCINLEHLYVGSQGDNLRDMYRRGGRQPVRMLGTGHPRSKLTDDDVRDIRWLADAGASDRSIAAQHNISPGNVGFIKQRKTWKHVV